MSGKISKKGKKPEGVDNWLDDLGLYRKNVAYDETCLFRAVSEQLFNCQVFQERVRKESIDYGRSHYQEFIHLINSEEDWHMHLDSLEKHMVICGNLEINLISKKYNRDVLIFHANQRQIYDVTKRSLPTVPLMLCLMNDDHYDAVYTKQHIENAGFCQSIAYKILYEDVFKIPNVNSIVSAMLHETTPVINQMELEEREQAAGGKKLTHEDMANAIIAPFPFKVAKALDPSIYRNIEYDSWGEVRREFRLGDWYYGDEKLKLGTRCILNDTNAGETFDCYIQELHKDQDKCVVYLTKFAEKRVVKYSDLAPESDAKPWPLPYRFSKNIVIRTTPQLAPIEKIKMKRKKNKERGQHSKSLTDLSVTDDGLDHISAFVGIPLHMQNNESNKAEVSSDAVGLTLPPSEGLITPVTPDINHYPQRYDWEQVHWPTSGNYTSPENAFYSQQPEQCLWPQGPATAYYEYKPVVASAPVTPNVIPYHDTSYPFYFNYHMESYPQYPVTPTTPVPVVIAQRSPESSDRMTENFQHMALNHQQSTNEVSSCHASPQSSTLNDFVPKQNIAYVSHTSQPMDVYPHLLNLPSAAAPVIYTAMRTPDVEMVVPGSPVVLYTSTNPGMEMSCVPPSGHLYSPGQNVPTVPWCQPAAFPYNSQGFVFPPPNHQAK